jgi:hypothetical protein
LKRVEEFADFSSKKTLAWSVDHRFAPPRCPNVTPIAKFRRLVCGFVSG